MTHYWPISNGTMRDTIGSADMSQGNATLFTTDRFGCPDSALALNGGWTQVPSGFYFNTPQFTISVWIYPQQIGFNARVIDFGNNGDFIIFRIGNLSRPGLNMINSSISLGTCTSGISLLDGVWQFLATTFDGSVANIYIDGVLTATKSIPFSLPSLVRVYNYIGKPSNTVHGYSWSYLDDLRFYNKSLTQAELIQVMTSQNVTSCQTTTTSTSTTTTTSSKLSFKMK